ncbi:MAG: DUF881 domain-containing protein [Eubacteriales bacterium]|jgi:uncharacterized protein YlxW (UPF0749 family)|nr:DUF881 domain-containing protein [Eubacteriales bacterium]MDQ7788778.1 DUF881 domain-containing protein [Clostridia bacterium]MDZ4044018.1 DUF881 domain-containing protein [Eubacteriales bacterium]MDZ7610878.1 DUF881 domain-containing protein [Eubacteriales bacterium]
MKGMKHGSIVLVAIILGVLLALQFRVSSEPQPAVASGERARELTNELSELRKEKQSLALDVADLEERVMTARQGIGQAEAAIINEIEKHRVLAGLTDVAGPGVEIILQNVRRSEQPADAAVFSIRDEELVMLVNELRGAGAEAIAVNGQRIISTSEIRLAFPFINVNLIRISPPYTVSAIGDPEALRNMVELSGGLVEILRDWGIDVQVEVLDEVIVPAYQGTIRLEYTSLYKEGD